MVRNRERGSALRALRSGPSVLEGRGKMMRRSEKGKFVFPFEKLDVWQLAIDLADFILNLLESFPANKYLRLIGQMEAAVSSIAQNTCPVK